MNWKQAVTPLTLAMLVTGCADEGPVETATRAPSTGDVTTMAPPDAFLDNLRALCGRAFAGKSSGPSAADLDLGDEKLVMHVRRCTDDEVQIPLHMGSNRSRTWLVTRTEDGLRLKHDHRLPDGSDDATTQYGGDTLEPGTATRQSFPADAFTAELIPDGATNIWSMTIEPGESFTYHLTRHGAPRATFEFDLTEAVEPPPAPWGYEDS